MLPTVVDDIIAGVSTYSTFHRPRNVEYYFSNRLTQISTQDRTHANKQRNEHTNADTKAHKKAHTSARPTNQPRSHTHATTANQPAPVTHTLSARARLMSVLELRRERSKRAEGAPPRRRPRDERTSLQSPRSRRSLVFSTCTGPHLQKLHMGATPHHVESLSPRLSALALPWSED